MNTRVFRSLMFFLATLIYYHHIKLVVTLFLFFLLLSFFLCRLYYFLFKNLIKFWIEIKKNGKRYGTFDEEYELKEFMECIYENDFKEKMTQKECYSKFNVIMDFDTHINGKHKSFSESSQSADEYFRIGE